MRQHSTVLIYPNTPGVSLPEYCILVVLVGALCVAGLQALGNSAGNLLQGSIQQLDIEGTQPLQQSNMKKIAKSAAQQTDTRLASGTALNQSDQAAKNSALTDQPTLQLGTSDSSSGTNVSSSEGQQNMSSNTPLELADTFKSASKLEEMAKAATDPTIKQYYYDLAKWTYYLAGTEGVLSNVKGLSVNDKLVGANRIYTARNALSDMMSYKRDLAQLIKNPPKGVPQSAVDAVKPLTSSTLGIARSYMADNSKFINRNGTVNASINKALATTNPTDPAYKFSKVYETNRSYAQIVGVKQMRQRVITVLNENPPGAAPVITTINNGISVDSSKPTLTQITP